MHTGYRTLRSPPSHRAHLFSPSPSTVLQACCCTAVSMLAGSHSPSSSLRGTACEQADHKGGGEQADAEQLGRGQRQQPRQTQEEHAVYAVHAVRME